MGEKQRDGAGAQPAAEQEPVTEDTIEDLEPQPEESVKITGGSAAKSSASPFTN